MSLAGVDPTADVGIPGNATNVRQVEPIVERVESNSSKQTDLAHTNMKLGLDVIFKQFVYMGTWRWSTSDAPGKVLATFPIHPSSCNEFNDQTNITGTTVDTANWEVTAITKSAPFVEFQFADVS